MVNRIILFIISFSFTIKGLPQHVAKETVRLPDLKSSVSTDTLIEIKNDEGMTGIAFRTGFENTFTGSILYSKSDTFFLKDDIHETEEEDSIYSNVVVFDQLHYSIRFFPGKIKGEIVVYKLNSGKTPDIEKLSEFRSQKAITCDEPYMIDQTIWREGLPPPSYSRIVHMVNHLIVHHSATSNALTNYTDVVRNIYLYHTQTRGWSDIGYNYVIAQDGTIYKGRDPDIYEQDNIMGAHFCSRNTGTMGVCILGDYTNTSPTDTSISSLEFLLSWKADKDSLDPQGTQYHPLNSNLDVISGHRDGCATICPGDGIYNRLTGIRNNVSDIIYSCNKTPTYPLELKITPLPFETSFLIHSPSPISGIDLYETSGKKIFTIDINNLYSFTLKLPDIRSGFYLLKIVDENKSQTVKMISVRDYR